MARLKTRDEFQKWATGKSLFVLGLDYGKFAIEVGVIAQDQKEAEQKARDNAKFTGKIFIKNVITKVLV